MSDHHSHARTSSRAEEAADAPSEAVQEPPAEDEATPEQPVVQRAGVPLVEPDHDADDAAEDTSPDQRSAG